MKKTAEGIFFLIVFFIAADVLAQVYEGKYEKMTRDMDRAVQQHQTMAADVPPAGDVEDRTPQEMRYLKMTQPMDEGADVNLNAEYRTVREAVEADK